MASGITSSIRSGEGGGSDQSVTLTARVDKSNPLKYVFSYTASGFDGEIIQATLDFGDKTVQELASGTKTATHTYAKGIFYPTIKVVSDTGERASAQTKIHTADRSFDFMSSSESIRLVRPATTLKIPITIQKNNWSAPLKLDKSK